MSELDILNQLNIGSSKESLEGKPNSPLGIFLTESVNEIIGKLRKRLTHYDADSSGELAQSLIIGKVKTGNDSLEVEMLGEFYWKFVNYGVNGTLINRGAPNHGTQPTTGKTFKQMVDQWISDRGIVPRDNISSDSLNFLIRRKIVQEGKEKRPFFTDIVNTTLERELTKQVTALMGKVIEINIVDPWQ